MTGIPPTLTAISERLKSGKPIDPVTARDLLKCFNAERRTPWLTNYISAVLAELGLRVEPDLAGVNLDVPLEFSLAPEQREISSEKNSSPDEPAVVVEDASVSPQVPIIHDATLRVRVLSAANAYPVVVAPEASLSLATTIMVSKDFSQLPVVEEGAVRGAISWRSIGRKLALGVQPTTVAAFLEPPLEIRGDTPLIAAIANIAARDYALINDDSGHLVGLVTASDLSLEFKSLSEPFLLLREIETYIRNILTLRFPADRVQSLADPKIKRKVRGVADLSLGEYLFALRRTEVWKTIGIAVDRKTFGDKLDEVRDIRNDVMHFDPDPIQESHLETLRELVRLLQAVGESLRTETT